VEEIRGGDRVVPVTGWYGGSDEDATSKNLGWR
jgi:hypothetical protein